MAYSAILHLSLHLCCDHMQIPLGHRKKCMEKVEEEVLCLGAGMYWAFDLYLFPSFSTCVSTGGARSLLLLQPPDISGSSDHCHVDNVQCCRADLYRVRKSFSSDTEVEACGWK